MSTHVDEGLLSKLVNKYGVENASKGPNRAKLWAKVTKDYNSITGNMHTKARLDKKWQNVKHGRKPLLLSSLVSQLSKKNLQFLRFIEPICF